MPVSVSAGRSPGAPTQKTEQASRPSSSTFWLHGLGRRTYPLWPQLPHLQNWHNYAGPGGQHTVGAQDLLAGPWPGLCVHTLPSAPLPGAPLSNSLMITLQRTNQYRIRPKTSFIFRRDEATRYSGLFLLAIQFSFQFGQLERGFFSFSFHSPKMVLQSTSFSRQGVETELPTDQGRPASAQGYAPGTVTAGAPGGMGGAARGGQALRNGMRAGGSGTVRGTCARQSP